MQISGMACNRRAFLFGGSCDLVMLDHFFPSPDRRNSIDDDFVAEKRGSFMTFRF